MKYFICFDSSSIASLALKKQEFEVESLLWIKFCIAYERKNSMFNISRSTHSQDSIFGMHMDRLTNFWLSGENL